MSGGSEVCGYVRVVFWRLLFRMNCFSLHLSRLIDIRIVFPAAYITEQQAKMKSSLYFFFYYPVFLF